MFKDAPYGRNVLPELSKFSSDQTYVATFYGGQFRPAKTYKNIIYCQFGEVCNENHLSQTILDQVPDSNVILITHRNYSKAISERCHVIKIPNLYAWYTTQLPQCELKFDQTAFQKRFLSLQWHAFWPRLALIQFLFKEQLLDKFFISYQGKPIFDQPEGKREFYFYLNEHVGETWFNKDIDHEQLLKLIPLEVDPDVFNRDEFMWTNHSLYQNSFASFVNETYIDENFNVFFTEKIFRPFSMGHPFLLFSSAGALKHLQTLGFETFGDIFDESYDHIENPQLRFEFLLREAHRVCNLSDQEIMSMYQHIVPKLQRNFDFYSNQWHKNFQQELDDAMKQIENLLE